MPESDPVPPVLAAHRRQDDPAIRKEGNPEIQISVWASIVVLCGLIAWVIFINREAIRALPGRIMTTASSGAPHTDARPAKAVILPSPGPRGVLLADSAGPPRPVVPPPVVVTHRPPAQVPPAPVRFQKDWASGMPDNAVADGLAKAILAAPLGAAQPAGLREVSALVREICAWRDEPTPEMVALGSLGKGGVGDRFDRAFYAALKLRGMGYPRVDLVIGVGPQSPRGTAWVEFETAGKRLLIDAALATPKLFEPLAPGSPSVRNRVIDRIVVEGMRSGH